jgi:hypothetical protein
MFLAMAASALATPGDPGETAVHFLEKIRTNKLNLEPGGDTALSPQTSGQKRQQIARRLERMARDLGNDPLEVGTIKLDDDLAAVLVRKTGGFNPDQLQVFPVALVKRGAQWLASPVPASFENSGVGFATSLRQRLATLEDWMLREQALDLQQLRDQAADRLRRQIALTLPPATLRALDSAQAADRFLAACGQRNLTEILGLLGGLSQSLPDDWPLRLKAAQAAITAAAEVPAPWRLLISADVLRAVVSHEESGDTAQVSIACLDPAKDKSRAALPHCELVHLELSKSSDGLWQIDLPGNFLQDEANPDTPADENLDADLLNAFPAKLAGLYPPSPGATAQQALRDLLATLQQGSPSALMRFIHLDEDPAIARAACARATQIRWSLREPTAVHSAVQLAMHEDGNLAAAACQFFSASIPDRLNLKILYFEKSKDGWYWTPEPKPQTAQACRDWADHQTQYWPDQWQQVFLTESPQLASLPAADAPTEAASRQLIESWLEATRAGEVMTALRLTARLNTPASTATFLRNFGYELAGAHRNSPTPAITNCQRGGIWAAVGTRTDLDGKPSFPFYSIVGTPAGPRILLEIDLFAAASRSRDFLNQTTLDHLHQANAAAADALKPLFNQYQAEVAKPPRP